MAPKLEEPTSVEEAQKYVGTELWKFWPETRKYYHGRVTEIDTLLENDEEVVEEGLFYKIEYADGDGEHVLWEELARLLANSAKWSKKRKNADAPVGASNVSPAAAGNSPAVSKQPAPSSKRRRKQQQQLEVPDSEAEDAHDTEDILDSADEEYDAPAAAKPASKRSKGKQQVPDSGTRNNSRQQRHRAAASPEASHERNDAAAAAAAGSEEAAAADEADAQEQQEDFEEMSNAAAEQILRECINEVVTVRHQGLAGHIKSVQVQNFMCHQNFAIDLGTHVNVIAGSNGSGKSAVLQAIQSCLGVKARDTGRGEKMKDFVRTGCHDSKVQVTLWNTGEDAYRHREFGDTITVERTIKITGVKETASSKVRLLSSTGRVISQRQDELNAMKDHLNIDAGNALAVMTQDVTRSFLCGSVADKKKYELFMNATMLADMQAALRKAQGYVNQMKEIMKGIRDEHMKRQNRLKEVEQKLQKLEESEGLLGQRVMYERAVCWVAVENTLQKTEELKESIEVKRPPKRAAIEQLLEQIVAQLDQLREEEESLAAAAEADQATQQNFASDVRQLAEDVKRARLEYRHKSSALQKLELKLKQATTELNSLLESTRETNDDRRREFEENKQQHQAKVEVEEQKMQAAEAAFRQCEEELQKLSGQEQQKTQEINELQRSQQSTQAEFNNFQQELRHLQAAKGQKQAMFGTQHVTLRALVDRNRRSFDRVPVGPIGAHLTLTDQKWDIAAEVVLGSRLDSWIVHSSNDEKVLRDLANNVNFNRINIIVASFNRPPYNLSRVNIRPGWSCLRQFVKVEHPEVPHIIDNKLMDLTHYELAIVDEDDGRCKSAVYNHAAGPDVGLSVHIGGRSWARRRAAVVTTNYYPDRRPRLSQSFEASLQNCRQYIAEREATLREVHQALITANQELQRLRQESAAAMRASKTAKGNQMRAQAALNQIQAQAPVFDPIDEEDADDMLAEQKRTLQEQIQTLNINHDRAKTEAEQAHTAMGQANQLYNGRKQEMDEVISQLGGRQEEIDRLAQKKQTEHAAKIKVAAELQKFDDKTDATKQQLEKFTQELELHRTAALRSCDEETGFQSLAAARAHVKQRLTAQMEQRIASGDSRHAGMTREQAADIVEKTYQQCCHHEKAADYFSKELTKIERKIAAVQEDAGGSKEELQHQRDLAKGEFNRHYRTYEDCRKTLEATSVAVHKRWTKYYDLFDDISKTVSQKFHAYMHRRGHSGRVKVSSEDGEVCLLVKINSQAAGVEAKNMRAVKDLKQLSGGERSFTTVAFILALGEYTENPFRAMDEFDVFMDPINRRIAMQTLLEFAEERGQFQFILLTPQDLQVVEDAKRQLESAKGKPLPEGFVKVVQMPAARPNQR